MAVDKPILFFSVLVFMLPCCKSGKHKPAPAVPVQYMENHDASGGDAALSLTNKARDTDTSNVVHGTKDDTAPLSANEILEQFLARQDRSSTELRLPSGDYTDFTPLLAFHDLEYLRIDNFQLTSIDGITVLTELENLETIVLWAEKVTDISPLSVFVNLVNLFIDVEDTCTDASELLSLTKLESLAYRPVSATAVQNIARLASLKNLSLSSYLEIPDLSPLRVLTDLATLRINNFSRTKGPLDFTWLKSLHNLECLELEGFIINDVRPLISLPRLRYLDVRFSTVSDENIRLLKINIETVDTEYDKDH